MKPWVTVNPWEQGLRIRLGKYVKRLEKGVHLKLPWLDTVYVLPTRVRMITAPMQTLMSKDGKPISIALACKYRVEDIEKVFNTVHQPEATIVYWIQGIVGDMILNSDASALSVESLQRDISEKLQIEHMGFAGFEVFITDLAIVRTYRLLKEDRWVPSTEVEHTGRQL